MRAQRSAIVKCETGFMSGLGQVINPALRVTWEVEWARWQKPAGSNCTAINVSAGRGLSRLQAENVGEVPTILEVFDGLEIDPR